MVKHQDSDLYQVLFSPNLRKGEIKKMQIIESAIECLATIGPDATTNETIGKKINLSRSHVGYYFRSKDEIIEHCIRMIAHTSQNNTILALEKASKNFKSQITALISAFFNWVNKNNYEARVFYFFYYLCTINDSYRKLNTQIKRSGFVRLKSIIEGEINPKKLAPISMDTFVDGIQNLVYGRVYDVILVDKKENLTKLKKETVDLVISIIEKYKS